MLVKRLHEYKRQLLLTLCAIVLYNRLVADPSHDMLPRTFIFSPPRPRLVHAMAKLIASG